MRPLRAGAFAVALASGACGTLLGIDEIDFATDGGADGASVADGADARDADATTADVTGGDDAADGAHAADAAACRVTTQPATSCTTNCVSTIVPAPVLVDGGFLGPYTFGIVVDDTSVYWVSQNNPDGNGQGVIFRAAKDGGVAERLTEPSNGTTTLAVDDTFLYWLVFDTGDPTQVDTVRLPKTSASCGSACVSPDPLDGPADRGNPVQSAILPLRNAGLLALSSRQIWQIPDGGAFQAAEPTGEYPSMAPWGDQIFFISSTGLNVSTFAASPLTLGIYSSFASPEGGAKFIASDCSLIFGSIFDPVCSVSRFDPTNPDAGWSALTTIGKTGPVYSFAVDDSFVYVGYANGYGLDRITKKTGDISNLPSVSVYGIALDDDAIYFGDHGEGVRVSGAILRVLK